MIIPPFLLKNKWFGNSTWSAAAGPKKRIQIAWIFASLLDRTKQYTASEIETGLRQILNRQVFDDPVCSPDHIRVAMIENGFLERDEQGKSYRVPENFFDAFGDFGRLLSQAIDSGQERIGCPICEKAVTRGGLQVHILNNHVDVSQVNEIVAKYFE